MKKIVGLAVILLVLVLGSYYGMGYLTEKKIKENIHFMNRSKDLSASVLEYKRGWFTSSAVLNWHVHVVQQGGQNTNPPSQLLSAKDYDVKVPVKIYHGPVVFHPRGVQFGLGYAHVRLIFPKKYLQEQFNASLVKVSVEPQAVIDFFINYLGNTRIDMSVPAFKLLTQTDASFFDWLGMSTTTTLSSKLDRVNGQVKIDGINYEKNKTKLLLKEVSSNYRLHKTEKGLFLGEVALAIPSFIMVDEQGRQLELKYLQAESDSDIENGLFHSRFKASIEKINAPEQAYGPGNIKLAIRNLDADALIQLNNLARQAKEGNNLEIQRIFAIMATELPKLFSKGAEFEIQEMDFVLPEGKMQGSLAISLPKGGLGGNFLEVMQKIHGRGKLKMPMIVIKRLVTESIRQKMTSPQQTKQQTNISEQLQPQSSVNEAAQVAADSKDISQQVNILAEKQLADLIKEGVLLPQGSDYFIEVELNQGRLTINGKPYTRLRL